MKPIKSLIAASIISSMSVHSFAAELNIEIQNLTQGIYYTPFLVSAHSSDAALFEIGSMASDELQAMAEGGDISGLMNQMSSADADIADVQAELSAPGSSRSFELSTSDNNTLLSITAMMLPTNDGFVALNGWTIPTESGTYTVYLNAYDAGTEANDEVRGGGAPGTAGFPVPPPLDPLLGSNGTGVTSVEENNTVHIHRGNLGDSDINGGTSDIQNTVQRWLNPVAKVTITVN